MMLMVMVVCAMMQHVGREHVDDVRDAGFYNPHRRLPLVLFHVPTWRMYQSQHERIY